MLSKWLSSKNILMSFKIIFEINWKNILSNYETIPKFR